VRRVAAAAVLFGAAALPLPARTWTVGGAAADFPLIAPAVAAAADGDIVLVRGGVYREDLVIRRRIVLAGERRPVLVGTGEGTVVEIAAAEAVLRGFDIEGSGTGLTNRMDAGVRVTGDRVQVADNRIRRVFYGIVVEGSGRSAVRDNAIDGLAELAFGRRGDGIYLYRAPETEVKRNAIGGMRDAIYLQYSPRCRVIGNRVSGARYGLHDMFSDGAEIGGNTFSDCSAGANVMNCRRVTVAQNRFASNRGVTSVGLALKECDESRIADNDFVDNARGLQVEGSSRNRFLANRFRYNDVAVTLFASAEENLFTENDFRDNDSGLVFAGGTTTNRFAENGRGNRWSGYRGFDFDGRGVGSAPHPLLGAFERLEGNNPAARLFLKSPAAGALELAAQTVAMGRPDIVDPAPLFGPGEPAAKRRGAHAGLAAAGVILAASLAVSREVKACSKS
jgi:nitrous oxidase accessory protein